MQPCWCSSLLEERPSSRLTAASLNEGTPHCPYSSSRVPQLGAQTAQQGSPATSTAKRSAHKLLAAQHVLVQARQACIRGRTCRATPS